MKNTTTAYIHWMWRHNVSAKHWQKPIRLRGVSNLEYRSAHLGDSWNTLSHNQRLMRFVSNTVNQSNKRGSILKHYTLAVGQELLPCLYNINGSVPNSHESAIRTSPGLSNSEPLCDVSVGMLINYFVTESFFFSWLYFQLQHRICDAMIERDTLDM